MNKQTLRTIKNDMWETLYSKKYLKSRLKTRLAELEQRRQEALAENAAVDASPETIAYWNRETNKAYDQRRMKLIDEECRLWHNDQSYYLIYKDGSEVCITAEEILGGDPFPKMSDIVYAEMMSADDHMDTETGDLDWYSDEAMEACDYDYDVADERKWQYETAIQYKFGTKWAQRWQQSHPEFVPAAI